MVEPDNSNPVEITIICWGVQKFRKTIVSLDYFVCSFINFFVFMVLNVRVSLALTFSCTTSVPLPAFSEMFCLGYGSMSNTG